MDGWTPLIVVCVAAIAVAYSVLTQRVTIMQYQRGLKYVRGRCVGVIGPGRYTIWRRTTTIVPTDIRPTTMVVAGQEVLSSDGLSVRGSLAVTYEVFDPDIAVNKAEDYTQALYQLLQLALRDAIGGSTLEDLLAHRAEMTERIQEIAGPGAEALGLRLVSVGLRDITLPGDLKKVFSQVVKARHEGLAALERARGETAALRNLANAARMIERSPGMMPLRLLHAMDQSSGNTYVIGLPSATTPLPIQQGDARELASEADAGDDSGA